MSWRSKWILTNSKTHNNTEMYGLVGQVDCDGGVIIIKDRVSGVHVSENSVRVVSLKTFLGMTQNCRSLWYEDLFR